MLDEIREYEQYTFEPVEEMKKEHIRLKFANLIKKDFGGLVRAMTIVARQCIFRESDEAEDFDEESVRNHLKEWCDGWLNRYIRHAFLEKNLEELREKLKDEALVNLLGEIQPDSGVEVLVAAKDEFFSKAKELGKEENAIFGRISSSIEALKELQGKKTYFAKRLFESGESTEKEKPKEKDFAQKKNDYHKITYDRIIANALEQGRLHRYYLVCKSDSVPFDLIRKYTEKNKQDGKELIDTDKDLILKMTAAYLLQQAGYNPEYAPEYVVITLTDISNWMIKKDKPSNFEFEKYKFRDTGESLFDKRTISSTDKKKDGMSKKGNLTKTRIHPQWAKQFYLVDESEIDNLENRGRIFFSDVAGKMLSERENKRYNE